MKFEPEILSPAIMRQEPEDSLISLLIGDTLKFVIGAENPMEDSLIYEWFIDDNAIGADTTVILPRICGQ